MCVFYFWVSCVVCVWDERFVVFLRVFFSWDESLCVFFFGCFVLFVFGMEVCCVFGCLFFVCCLCWG